MLSGAGAAPPARRGLRHFVHVVGEGRPRDVGDDVEDLPVAEPRAPDIGEVRGGHVSAGLDEAPRETRRGGDLRVRPAAVARGVDVGVGEARALAEVGVGGEAIVAAVGFRGREGNRLARLRVEALSDGAEEGDHPFERGGGLGGDAEQVRHDAEALADALEQVVGGASGNGGIDRGDAAHGVLSWVSRGSAVPPGRCVVVVRDGMREARKKLFHSLKE